MLGLCSSVTSACAAGATPQQHGLLFDGLVQGLGHQPHRAVLQPATFKHLRQGDKAQFSIAGVDKTERLANALSLHQFGRQGAGQPQCVDGLPGGFTIRRGFRVGIGQFAETGTFEHVTLCVHQRRVRRPQHQSATGVGKAAAGRSKAFFLQRLWHVGVGGQKYVKWCPIPDLGIELASCAQRHAQSVSGGFLQHRSDGLDGFGKVGCDRNLGLPGHRVDGSQHGQQESCKQRV